VTLKMLIQEAYDFRGPNADDMVVAGPKWITSERFTIETKAEEPATVAGMRAIGTAGFDVATSKAGVCDWAMVSTKELKHITAIIASVVAIIAMHLIISVPTFMSIN